MLHLIGPFALATSISVASDALVTQVASPETGNVIFFHPDGAGVNHWNAARLHIVGPDGEF